MLKLSHILCLLIHIAVVGSVTSQNKGEARTVLLILDGLASGAIDRIPLENLAELKRQGCYYEQVHLPLPDHPEKSDTYPWSCSLPNPVLMSGTVFIGQPGVRESLIQHQFEDQKTAFVVNDGAYRDVAGGFDRYENLREEFEDLFRDERVLERAFDLIQTEDPVFLRLHFQGPGSAGHRSTEAANAGEPWHQNIWEPQSPYVKQLKKADSLVGAFMRWMHREGRLEHTVILIMGDHGQAQTGAHPPYDPDSNRTELLLLGDRVKRGKSFDYAEIIDIAPTIAYLHGLAPPIYAIGRVLEEAFSNGLDTIPSSRHMRELNTLLISAHERTMEGKELPGAFKDIRDISTWHEGLSPVMLEALVSKLRRLLDDR